MGCSSSTPVGDDTPAPRPAKKRVQQEPDLVNLTIPEVKWEKNESWSEWVRGVQQELIAAERQDELPWLYQDLLYKVARGYLASMYRECEDRGTIEEVGAGEYSANDKCKSSARSLLVLDASFTGIVHALALVIAKPPAKPLAKIADKQPGEGLTQVDSEEQQLWLVSGGELNSAEVESAKRAMLQRLSFMRANGINVNHALLHVFINADLITCRFDASPKPPTINRCEEVRPKILIDTMNSIVKDTKKAPHAFKGLFAPNWFRQTVRDCSNGYEGSTVWDEGSLPFKLPNGRMYHEPTRLLVTRLYEYMTEIVDELPFTATPPPFPGSEDETPDSVTLVRKVDPTKEPGGIVRIVLVIGISKDIVWPKIGDYAKTSTMRAGEQAVMEYAKGLYAKGVLDRCSIRVHMGTDESVFKFVGDPQSLTKEVRALPHPAELNKQAETSTSQSLMVDRTLELDFGLKVSILPRHDLMGSESQFQAIKQYMTNKAKSKTPEELRAQAMMIAPMAARTFLANNFPCCEISDEGPLLVIHPDGTETLDHGSRLIIARDHKQEPSSVVAAINVVPCPSAGASFYTDKSWLETPEMKEADDKLLLLLRKWYAEGKISKLDCMAQTQMVKDATIYKFVDGERFEDYSEERMNEFRWG
ncbi:hypothetical protein ACLX1H_005987 [Fusarium chlamydosporum]